MPCGSMYGEEIAFLPPTHSLCVAWFAAELLEQSLVDGVGADIPLLCVPLWAEGEPQLVEMAHSM